MLARSVLGFLVKKSDSDEFFRPSLETAMNNWSPKYKKIMDNLAQTRHLLTFFEFPLSIKKSICSTNLIESLNKEIKRQTKKRIIFPNKEALERCLVSIFANYNFKNEQRIHKGFGLCSDTLESLIL
ncbi:Mobile element protein [Streptococcus sp. DD10]|nr:Mobile element protein [Streptococcus sp. DD10]